MAGWLLLGLVAIYAATGPGCAPGKGRYDPGAGAYDAAAIGDPLVVTIENIREIALNVFDKFMALERTNEAALLKLNPAIHQTAELIRRDGQKVLNTLTDCKVQYQKSRSAEDATKLKNALAAVQALLNSAITYLAEAAP